MNTQTKQLLTVVLIVVIAVAVYAGSAFAQSDVTTPTPAPNLLQRMQSWLGPEAWAQRVERMTQMHGAAFVNQRLQWLAEQTDCPCRNGATGTPGVGPGMMNQGRAGMMNQRMGHRMTGQGMMGQQRFNQPMGPHFWQNNPPAATPMP